MPLQRLFRCVNEVATVDAQTANFDVTHIVTMSNDDVPGSTRTLYLEFDADAEPAQAIPLRAGETLSGINIPTRSVLYYTNEGEVPFRLIGTQ